MKQKNKKKKTTAPMDSALRYLGYRSRTVREVERHLDEQQYGEFEIMQVIDRLTDLGLLNDRKYAEDYVSSVLRTKPTSMRKLRIKLTEHEVPKDIIDEVLADIPEESESQCAFEVARKYANIYANVDPDERGKIVMRRLLSRGYTYATAKEALERLHEETGDISFDED
ncbi:MAG: RecX family transcriptional regulator [Clostridia bacterium]|nr:RecX family transcriptional regulator [Clostridia bacterium]